MTAALVLRAGAPSGRRPDPAVCRYDNPAAPDFDLEALVSGRPLG